jgi:hypothetical protein
VSVPALLLVLIAAVGSYARWPTTYSSFSELTLLGSPVASEMPGFGSNPYLATDGLDSVDAALVAYLTSDPAIAQIKALGVTESCTVAIPPYAAGPFFTITVQGNNPAEVRHATELVTGYAERALIQLQESVRPPIGKRSLVTSAVISAPSKPTKVKKKKLEIVAGITIGVLIFAIAAIFGAEARAKARGGNEKWRRQVPYGDGAGLDPRQPASEYSAGMDPGQPVSSQPGAGLDPRQPAPQYSAGLEPEQPPSSQPGEITVRSDAGYRPAWKAPASRREFVARPGGIQPSARPPRD